MKKDEEYPEKGSAQYDFIKEHIEAHFIMHNKSGDVIAAIYFAPLAWGTISEPVRDFVGSFLACAYDMYKAASNIRGNIGDWAIPIKHEDTSEFIKRKEDD